MRLLCASDIHLGRAPALPGDLDHRAAWNFVLDAARRERPDLLVLAGDVIDSDNQYLETWGPLREGVLGLLREGMSIAAVAGNHDAEVFPELHAAAEREVFPGGARFHLLRGRSEANLPEWQELRLEVGGEPLTLVGWSFLTNHFLRNPMDTFRAPQGPGPVLGLLHGDLSGASSRHAPLRAADLEAAPVDQWVLGHIHAPSGAAGRRFFYCGSPLPLRSTERGAHGVWRLVCQEGRFQAPVLIPSPVRVETLEVVPREERPTAASLAADALEALRGRIREIQMDNPGLACLHLKVRVTGRRELGGALPALDEGLAQLDEVDGVRVAVLGPAENACAPLLPLERWAQGEGAQGRLARMVLSLEAGAPDAEAEALLEDLERTERESLSERAYADVGDAQRDPAVGGRDWAASTLLHTCWRVLDAMRAEEEAHG
jgi:DNA repair protein SbcD/Mre11